MEFLGSNARLIGTVQPSDWQVVCSAKATIKLIERLRHPAQSGLLPDRQRQTQVSQYSRHIHAELPVTAGRGDARNDAVRAAVRATALAGGHSQDAGNIECEFTLFGLPMILQKVVNRIATSFRLASPILASTRTTSLAEQVISVRNSHCGSDRGSAPLRFVPTRRAPLPPYDMKLHVARVGHTIDKSAALGPLLASPPARVLSVLAAASTKNDGELTAGSARDVRAEFIQGIQKIQERSANRSPASAARKRTDSPDKKRSKRPAPQPTPEMKRDAKLNEIERRIRALPPWTQALQDIQQGAANHSQAASGHLNHEG